MICWTAINWSFEEVLHVLVEELYLNCQAEKILLTPQYIAS